MQPLLESVSLKSNTNDNSAVQTQSIGYNKKSIIQSVWDQEIDWVSADFNKENNNFISIESYYLLISLYLREKAKSK